MSCCCEWIWNYFTEEVCLWHLSGAAVCLQVWLACCGSELHVDMLSWVLHWCRQCVAVCCRLLWSCWMEWNIRRMFSEDGRGLRLCRCVSMPASELHCLRVQLSANDWEWSYSASSCVVSLYSLLEYTKLVYVTVKHISNNLPVTNHFGIIQQ